jgi:hypothetical protein
VELRNRAGIDRGLLTVFVELERQGLIRHIGLSNITPKQLAEIRTITEIVCVQNFYNAARRNGDAFIDLEIGDTHPSDCCVASLALAMTVLNGITIWVRKRRSSYAARRLPYPHPVSSDFELTVTFREMTAMAKSLLSRIPTNVVDQHGLRIRQTAGRSAQGATYRHIQERENTLIKWPSIS